MYVSCLLIAYFSSSFTDKGKKTFIKEAARCSRDMILIFGVRGFGFQISDNLCLSFQNP
jgi:hypothetical protein